MLIGLSGRMGSGKDTVADIIQFLTDETDGTYKEYLTIGVYEAPTFIKKQFAGKLKQIAALCCGCKVEDFESQEFKATIMPKEWDTVEFATSEQLIRTYYDEEHSLEYAEKMGWKQIHGTPRDWERRKVITYREFLQKIGTEAMRNNVHENFWLNALFADYKIIRVDGWKPSYNDPDNAGLAPEAELVYPNWIVTDCRFGNEADAIHKRDGVVIRINRTYQGLQPENISTHPSETALDTYPYFDTVINNDGTLEELFYKVKTTLKQLQII